MTALEQQSEATRETVQRVYEVAGRADWDALADFFAPDVVLYEPDWLPYGGECRGVPGVIDGLRSIFSDVLELNELEVITVVSHGLRAVCVATLGGVVRVTGKPFRQRVNEEYELNDEGLVLAIRVFWWDGPRLLRAFE